MLYLHGIGHFHPETVIDNAFLESLDMGTNNDWIIQRTGIKTRRSVLSLEYLRNTKNKDISQAVSQAQYDAAATAAPAVEMALARAGLQSQDVGMVIAGGCSPECSLPANAALIADSLGIKAECLDVQSACSTFIMQLHLLNRMKVDALPDYILCVIPENWTKTIDYSDRRTAVLIGDATVATIVSLRKPSKYKVTYTTMESDPSGWDKVMTPTGGYFHQKGSAVQKFAIKKTLATIDHLLNNAGFNSQQDYFISHQANLRMLESVCRLAAISNERHWHNVEKYGNCGAAGAPSVLSQHWSDLQPFMRLGMVVVGAGLTWGGLMLEVGE